MRSTSCVFIDAITHLHHHTLGATQTLTHTGDLPLLQHEAQSKSDLVRLLDLQEGVLTAQR